MWAPPQKEVPGGAQLSPGSHAPLAMSSASSEPDDGDATELSRLGLDAVIQVSWVAALQHLPSGLQGHLKREGTLYRSHTSPAQGALSTCSRGQHEHTPNTHKRVSADWGDRRGAGRLSPPPELSPHLGASGWQPWGWGGTGDPPSLTFWGLLSLWRYVGAGGPYSETLGWVGG